MWMLDGSSSLNRGISVTPRLPGTAIVFVPGWRWIL